MLGIPKKSWLLLLAVGLLIFTMNIDYTAVNMTLVPIANELNVDLNIIQWILSAYVLVWGALVIPAAKIVNFIGFKKTIYVGVYTFLFGSVLIAFSYNIELIILGRVIQGVGVAIFTPPCWSIIFNNTPRNRQGIVMGLLTSASGVGLAVGPALGGYLIEILNWRFIYFINIPIVAIVLAILFFIEIEEKLKKESLDYVGALLFLLTISVFVFGLNQIEIWGFFSTEFVLLECVASLLFLIFCLRNRKSTNPLIPLKIYTNKILVINTICCAVFGILFSMIVVLVGLYLQNILNYSSSDTGEIFFALTISMGLLSPFGGILVDKFGVKKPLLLSVIASIIATIMMCFFNADTSATWIMISLAFSGIGIGCYFTAGNLAMLRSVDKEDVSIASGFYTMGMMMGDTISVVLSTSFLVLFGKLKLENILSESLFVSSEENIEYLKEIVGKAHIDKVEISNKFHQKTDEVLELVNNAFMFGFNMNMTIALILLLMTMFLIKRYLPD